MARSPEDLLAHADFVRDLARNLLSDEHRSADIAQDACLAAIENPPPSGHSLRAWMSKVTRNLAFKFFRSEGRRLGREWAAAKPDRVPSAEEVVEREETRRRVVDAVLALMEPYRSAILLRFYENLSHKEAAATLGVPLETMRTHLKRGLAQLRKELDRYYGDGRRDWALVLAPLAGLKGVTSAANASVSSSLVSGVIAMSSKIKIGIAAVLAVATLASLVFVVVQFMHDENAVSRDTQIMANSVSNAATPSASEDDPEELADADEEKTPLAPDQRHIRVSGRVCSFSNGDAVPGARLKFSVLPYRSEQKPNIARTDDLGKYEIVVNTPLALVTEALHVQVSATGFKHLVSTLPWGEAGQSIDGLNFKLHEDQVHVIRITDSEDGPIAGALIEFYDERSTAKILERNTDASGHVRVAHSELGFMSGSHRSLTRIMKITAPGMALHIVQLYYLAKSHFDIAMQPEQSIGGRIVDSESRRPVAGAILSSGLTDHDPLIDILEIPEARTDLEGQFHLPLITTIGNQVTYYIRYRISAPGYMPCWYRYAEFTHNNEFELSPAYAVKRIQLLDSTSNDVIPSVEIILTSDSHNEQVLRADDKGIFSCPFLLKDKNYTCIHVPGYGKLRNPFPHPDLMEEDPWPLKLEAGREEKIRILDPFGRPVPSIRVQLVVEKNGISFHSDNFTDWKGEAIYAGSNYDPGQEVTIRVFDQSNAKEFAPFRSVPFVIGSSEGKWRTYVLSYGTLCQTIKVVDGSGVPMQGEQVVADLNVEKGLSMSATWQVNAYTDDSGHCEFSLPEFDGGTVSVKDHPDTSVNIDFTDILSQREITLVLTDEYIAHSGVRGTVVDENEQPLENINIYFEPESHAGYSRTKSLTTNSKGQFNAPLEENVVYNLIIHSQRSKMPSGESCWYVAEDRQKVRMGDDLTIRMKRWPNRIRVHFMDVGNPVSRFDAWLQDGEGTRIKTAMVKKRISPYQSGKGLTANLAAEFYDVPPGKMKAVLLTDEGYRFETEILDLEEGQSLHKTIESD